MSNDQFGWVPPTPRRNTTGKTIGFSCLGAVAVLALIGGCTALVSDDGDSAKPKTRTTTPAAVTVAPAPASVSEECRAWIERELLDGTKDIEAEAGYAVCGDVPKDDMKKAIDDVTAEIIADPDKLGQLQSKGPNTSIGDGVYKVGEDIAAGSYKTEGPKEGSFTKMCYWSRNTNDSGELEAIIANKNISGAGRVTLKKGEFFETDGCQDWVLVK